MHVIWARFLFHIDALIVQPWVWTVSVVDGLCDFLLLFQHYVLTCESSLYCYLIYIAYLACDSCMKLFCSFSFVILFFCLKNNFVNLSIFVIWYLNKINSQVLYSVFFQVYREFKVKLALDMATSRQSEVCTDLSCILPLLVFQGTNYGALLSRNVYIKYITCYCILFSSPEQVVLGEL